MRVVEMKLILGIVLDEGLLTQVDIPLTHK